MGGLAFASDPDPVFVPRMKPEAYRAMRDRCQDKLRDLFVIVATPIEGPAKSSFGDIDLFVAWEREFVFPQSKPVAFSAPAEAPIDAVCRVLGAIRRKNAHGNVSIAVPWPEDIPYSEVEPKTEPSSDVRMNGLEEEQKDGEDEKAVNDLGPRCIQVDVHICESLTYLQWMLFKHAHGDLWNLLGSTIRPFGLTIDEIGLYVRIPEIEEFNKKEAKILLSTDPSEILNFLGLKFGDKEWEEPFASDQEIFEYAATCRLFWVKTESEGEEGEGGRTEIDRRKLKANDRRRMAFRPLFRKWIEEFIPACRDAGRFTSTNLTRDIVREQAFECFPGVQSDYDFCLAQWRIKKQCETLFKDVIKPAVPSDMGYERRGPCVSALKKIILHGDESFGGIVAPPSLKGLDGLFEEDAVRVWVENNWEAVLDAALSIQQKRLAAKMESKGATKRTGSGLEKP
ncbi:hypothetical protein O1611_g5716 [Lasiodiplodia mahajangana]|uniref:Uncharacterized protein n=1 Tax=Lasiodiplodia mahajangana TaxID=1108764 RepID=A0ACC2JKE0_9PEZI|nr:hypothetical protein O1611_g5716 [Lasiodiplodia mahajangana]